MDDQPARYILAALRSAGLEVADVSVLSYAPEAFGNMVAQVETNLGPLRVIFDRGFYIDELGQPLSQSLRASLIAKLEVAKRDAAA